MDSPADGFTGGRQNSFSPATMHRSLFFSFRFLVFLKRKKGEIINLKKEKAGGKIRAGSGKKKHNFILSPKFKIE
jgi:hypothetical protein